jgi:hypothetical protein
MRHPHARAAGAWDRIVAEVNAFDGDAVISHEFFGGASVDQARQAMARLAPAEVHVVVTARDLIGILPAFWQEQVKFSYRGGFADYDPPPVTVPPSQHWSWRTIDAADVLQRWSADLPADRVHVVTMPPADAPRDLLWKRFAEVCGFDPAVASLDLPVVNESMGVVEAELLRRVNGGLHEELRRPSEPARWVRRYLGLEILAKRKGDKLRVPASRVPELHERGQRIVTEIEAAGYHVVGDLDELAGPEQPPTSRQPEDVSDGELLEVALDVINAMLVDHRRLSNENTELHKRLSRRRRKPANGTEGTKGAGPDVPATPPSMARGVVRRARRLLG